MRIDLPRLPIGGLLFGFLLLATIGTFAAAFLWGGRGTLEGLATESPAPAGTPQERGQQIAAVNGCISCHSTTGEVIIGPSWMGLFGKEEALTDGSSVTVDAAYVQESILDPTAKVVADFSPVMPSFPALTEEDIQDVIAFMQSLSEQQEEEPPP